MAIISANLQFNRGGHGLLDYSSLQTNYSKALEWAKDPNSNAAVGQFIYLESAETIGDVEYAKGPYVVDAIGENAVITPLSKSVAGSPDLAGEVSDLKSSVGTLTSGLEKTDASVNALEATVGAIPGTYATKEELQKAIGDVDFTELENAIASKADAAALTKLSGDFDTYKTNNDAAVAANESAIGEVSTNLNNHIGDNTHLSEGERDRWTAAATAIEAFMDTTGTSDEVVNTLKEIQEYITSDASAAAKMTSDISAAQAKAEEALTAATNAETNANGYTDTEIGKVSASVATKLDTSVYDAKMLVVDGSISTIETSLGGKVDKVEGSSLVEDTLITKLGNMVEITSVEGDLSLVEGVLSVDLSGKVDKEEGKGLSSNDFTNELKAKLEGVAEGAEVNYIKSVGDNLDVDASGKLTVDLSALTTKLDASAKVNGVSFDNGEVTIDAGDIALESAITRGEELVYDANSSIQAVLAGLSARIDSLDPNISGEFGVSSVTAGSGIEVTGASSTPTIAVKVSAVEGNIVELKTDGVYVAAPEVPDMRSYWEAI